MAAGTAATAKALPIILAFGAAILMAGLGIGAAAFGLSYLVEAFGKLPIEKMFAVTAAILLLAAGLGGLAAGLASLSNPLSSIGLGIFLGIAAGALAIGVGIKLAADGMANFIDSLADLKNVSDVLEALTGAKDIAVSVGMNGNIQNVKRLLDDVKDADISAELENIALITTGTSATLMTENAVSQLITVASLADTIKNIFNPDINISIDGKALEKLMEDGVYKYSMRQK